MHTTGPAPAMDVWRELEPRARHATPFMSSGWAQAWWRHYGEGVTPCVVEVRDGGRAVGLAPLVQRRRGPLRVLEPVGMDPGDYWTVLAEPGLEAPVQAAVLDALRARRGHWDAWILRCLPVESTLEAAVDRAGLPSLVRPRIPAPGIDLPDSFDAYLRSVSSNRRQNLRRHLRRLDEGEVTLRPVTDPDALPATIRRWQGFREAQWSAQEKAINPAHLSARLAAFVTDCARDLLPTGQVLIWEFEVAGEVVGCYVNFADDEAFNWWLGGFDPAHAKLGLGKIAIAHGIRTSIDAGRARFDFGRGAEPYKYWYGALDRPLAARVVGSGSVRSRPALAAARVAIEVRGRRAAAKQAREDAGPAS